MVTKVLFLLGLVFAMGSVQAQESKIKTKVEASLYLPKPTGSISNATSNSDIKNDFGFGSSKASYFAVETTFDYDYVPNIYLSYFNLDDTSNNTLNTSKTIGNVAFNSKVNTHIKYQIFSGVLYQDFKSKGGFITLFGSPVYVGDIEFDVGVNIEFLKWDFNVKDATQSRWIKVEEFVGRPYFGLKYYLYHLSLYANISALSLGSVDSTSVQAGVDYNFDSGISLGVGYIYEDFSADELADTIDYTTSGVKVGFKYTF